MPNACARSKRSALFTSKKWKCDPTWIGRSPVFATVSCAVRRPAFASMSPSSSKYSPGIMRALRSSSNWVMNRHQLRSVGERALDLHLLQHLGNALHHVGTSQDRDAERHQVGHTAPVANALEHLGGDQGERLGVVQLEPAPAPTARHLGRGEDEQLVLLARGQMHEGEFKPSGADEPYPPGAPW